MGSGTSNSFLANPQPENQDIFINLSILSNRISILYLYNCSTVSHVPVMKGHDVKPVTTKSDKKDSVVA
jgi:hypothetical protein